MEEEVESYEPTYYEINGELYVMEEEPVEGLIEIDGQQYYIDDSQYAVFEEELAESYINIDG